MSFDLGIELAERGLIPDAVVRRAIRGLLAAQLARAERRGDFSPLAQAALRERLSHGPIAVETAAANAQHYELPPEFFVPWLGRRMKYSAALWPVGVSDLDAAEEAMLDLSCRRAAIEDGMRILELGCGWGSLTLWMAERYPESPIVAVTNSSSQAEWVRARAAERGLTRIEVVRSNVADFESTGGFDRAVSVEMFEHVRNHRELLRRIAGWLVADGLLFVHVFTNRRGTYLFETDDQETWMARHFFTGGLMPGEDLFAAYGEDLLVTESWTLSGLDYARTLEAWLLRLSAARDRALPALASVYGARDAARRFRRWRIFLLASAKLFAYDLGSEWRVGHYLFGRAKTS